MQVNKYCTLRVTKRGITNEIRQAAGTTLLAALAASGYFVDAPCGGNGKCKKCLVRANGMLSPRGDDEAGLDEGYRLACRAVILGDAEVSLDTEEENASIATEGRSHDAENVRCDRGEGYALAVDIGTTTVVCYLARLSDGARLGSAGAMNPQRAYGADVISRVSASFDETSCEKMTSLVRDMISGLADKLLREAAIGRDRITFVSIAGNTTMELLFAGIAPTALACIPFKSPTLFGDKYKASEFGFDFAPECELLLLPCAESFVGGDITAAILASGLYEAEEKSLLVDIGTNGEIALGSKEGILVAATAAGPAFEGADISCGMSSLAGAIRSVVRDGNGLAVGVIGGGEAKGICGSGLIDALAAMLSLGAVDETGRLLPPDEAEDGALPYLIENKEVAFLLAPGVSLSAGDVRKLQLAKAAIRAGIETLMSEAGVDSSDIARLYISGGFGSNISISSAASIGLIPPALAEKVVILGNGAGEGAAMVAVSREAEEKVADIRETCRYVDLSTSETWNELYIERMFFDE